MCGKGIEIELWVTVISLTDSVVVGQFPFSVSVLLHYLLSDASIPPVHEQKQ